MLPQMAGVQPKQLLIRYLPELPLEQISPKWMFITRAITDWLDIILQNGLTQNLRSICFGK